MGCCMRRDDMKDQGEAQFVSPNPKRYQNPEEADFPERKEAMSERNDMNGDQDSENSRHYLSESDMRMQQRRVERSEHNERSELRMSESRSSRNMRMEVEPEEPEEPRQREEVFLDLDNLIELMHIVRNNERMRPQNYMILLRLLQLVTENEPQGLNEPRGLNEQERQKLSRKVAREEGICAICQDKIQIDQNIIDLLCKHGFHEDCLKPWLERARSCPMCRDSIIKE